MQEGLVERLWTLVDATTTPSEARLEVLRTLSMCTAGPCTACAALQAVGAVPTLVRMLTQPCALPAPVEGAALVNPVAAGSPAPALSPEDALLQRAAVELLAGLVQSNAACRQQVRMPIVLSRRFVIYSYKRYLQEAGFPTRVGRDVAEFRTSSCLARYGPGLYMCCTSLLRVTLRLREPVFCPGIYNPSRVRACVQPW